MLQLCLGDFEEGWREYEWRCKVEHETYPDFGKPRWDGSERPNKTVLVYAEQGFGDTLQFIRYAVLVKQRVRRVILFCQKPLRQLLANVSGIDVWSFDLDNLPPFDMQIPLLSLPRIFRTTLATVPAGGPYISADKDLVQHWKDQLGDMTGIRVGISWQGSASYAQDQYRSIPVRHFAPLADLPNVSLLSLQKGYGVEQIEQVRDRFEILEMGDDFDETAGPFMDTAAVMKNLDLFVTSDTAVAHLAGALGIRVWLALPSVPDWRWLLDRDDCPWYPTMRLFRQRRRGDWDEVFQRMRDELQVAAPTWQLHGERRH